MEFACHTWAFNHIGLTEALGTIARMGFRYVDIGTGPHLNIEQVVKDPRGTAAQIRRDLEIFNLKLSDVYVMLPRISAPEADKREADLKLFRALLPFLIALQTPGVTISPGLMQPEDDDTALDRTIAALAEMVKAAHVATPATRMQVSIEPHMDSIAQKPETVWRLLEGVEDLSLTLDWAQFVCQDTPHDEIVKFIPRARHVQLRQARPKHLQTRFERGVIDPDAVITALQQADYQGVLCVEYLRTVNWHGAEEVNTLTEAVNMRNALRDARDALFTARKPTTEAQRPGRN